MHKRRPPYYYLVISLVSLLIAGLPYALAYDNSNADLVFSGFLVNLQDGNSYLAKMQEGWQGAWSFVLPFTAEQGKGAFLFLFYLFLGHVARWLNVSLLAVYHFSRLAGMGVMLFALYQMILKTLGDTGQARVAFFVSAMGSGLGWLGLAFGAFTADFWVAEAYPFLSGLVNPHFPLGTALILFLLLPIQSAEGPRHTQAGLVSGLAGLLLALISPFGVVLVLIVRGGTTLWNFLQREPIAAEVRQLIWISGLGLPFLLYDVWVTSIDPLLASWNRQNFTPSPVWWDTLLALSPALFLGIPGIIQAVKAKDSKMREIVIWAIMGLLLMYLPWSLQRRFMVGLSIPWVILAAYSIQSVLKQVSLKKIVSITWIVLAIPTNLITGIATLQAINQRDAAIYLDQDEIDAFTWIRSNTKTDDVFLSGSKSGLLIPAWTGRKVIYGHPYETVEAAAKQEALAGFEMNPERVFTDPYLKPADYIYASQRDQWQTVPGQAIGIPAIYENETVTIYRVDR